MLCGFPFRCCQRFSAGYGIVRLSYYVDLIFRDFVYIFFRSSRERSSTPDRPAGRAFRHVRLACISHHLTAEARIGPAITLLRLLAVLNVPPEYASLINWGSSSGARLVLTGLSRTSSRLVVRNAG